ncbi:hypothetical protein QFC22_001863 [Naganishia vaughanmartiniae]|uniref:Uncharacterized protein n=1 Tax=Naganishia vaughanmartiniae TaxID=1424756 RepID=A0ACC2XEH3_9TREE|nr:hypothetical protein QFC22_001863 [Naganishia vaughanmartiniae]
MAAANLLSSSPSSSITPLHPLPPVAMPMVSRARTRAVEFREVNVVDDILQSEADEIVFSPANTSNDAENSPQKRSIDATPGTNRSGVKRLRKEEEARKNMLRGTDIGKEKRQGGVKVLPKGQDVVQLPINRKGGSPAWSPIPYEEALQMQKDWRKNRWCMDKICNEYIGDRQFERSSGVAATTILDWREKVLQAYTALVEPYLIATSQVKNGKMTGAMLAYSMIDAIIGVADAEKLKEVVARVTTQVHERPDSWYCNLTLMSIARKALGERENRLIC